MRILAISRRYPTRRQPALPPDNREQFDALAAQHELQLIRPLPSRASLPALKPRRLRSAETATLVCPTFHEPAGIWTAKHVSAFAASTQAAVATISKQFEPQVVLASWTHPDGWTALRIARALGVPVVLKAYASDDRVRVQERVLARMVDELRGVDVVIATSRAAARLVVDSGIPRRRVHIVPDGTSVPLRPRTQADARRRLGLPETERIILCPAERLTAKDLIDLVKACAILRGQNVAFRCEIVGMAAGPGSVQRLVRSRGLDDRVFFLPSPRDNDRYDWLSACDVVAYPGYTDHATPVLREAVAVGRPFVATRVGTIPEVASPPFGRLVLAGAVGEMARALREALEQPPTASDMQTARLTIPWEMSAALLANHLQAVVDRHAALQIRRSGREDAKRRALVGRDASSRRLDAGADVDRLRQMASRRR